MKTGPKFCQIIYFSCYLKHVSLYVTCSCTTDLPALNHSDHWGVLKTFFFNTQRTKLVKKKKVCIFGIVPVRWHLIEANNIKNHLKKTQLVNIPLTTEIRLYEELEIREVGLHHRDELPFVCLHRVGYFVSWWCKSLTILNETRSMCLFTCSLYTQSVLTRHKLSVFVP